MKTISAPQAEEYLEWASRQNPGLWVKHSREVARAAGVIAEACGLDKERAHCLGLLHDIGRYKGVTALRHVFDGYRLMLDESYGEVANICLTHSFPLQALETYAGKDDLSAEQRGEIARALSSAVYDDYVLLIQLCDSLALPEGVCLMEKRLMDVAMRHGVNSYSPQVWGRLFALRDYFSDKADCSIYSLFPEVGAVTFES